MEQEIINLLKEVLGQNDHDAMNTYLSHRFFGWDETLKEAFDKGEGEVIIHYLTRLKYGVYT